MRDEWEHAHTDYTVPAQRRSPASLTDSEGDWRDYLDHSTPNGWLIRNSAMTETLVSGKPMHLLHVTRGIDAIRASREIHVSAGCLVGALYCAPLASQREGLRPHNLGAYLMRTKPSTTPLIFEVTPDAPTQPKGIDYLHLGAIHLRYQSYLTPAETDQLDDAVLAGLRAAAAFLDVALRNATGHATPAPDFIDQLSNAVAHVPFLGYLYFEVLSEYLMLHCTTPETKTYAAAGELNNWICKRLAFAAVDGMDKLFDLTRFNPRHHRLIQLIEGLEPDLGPGVAEYVRRRLSHLLARTALDPSQDASAVTFQGADLGTLQKAAPGLIGQMAFREIRYMTRYGQLYHCFEKARALEAWDYWNNEGIPTPFNGVIPKGEIGINPAYPRSAVRVWTAQQDSKGYLHPDEEIAAVLTPHLASWWAPSRQRETHNATDESRVELAPLARPTDPHPTVTRGRGTRMTTKLLNILTGINRTSEPSSGSMILASDLYRAMPDHTTFPGREPVEQAWSAAFDQLIALSTPKRLQGPGFGPYVDELTREVGALIEKTRPDAIHAQYLGFALSLAFARTAGSIPIISIAHGPEVMAAERNERECETLHEVAAASAAIAAPTSALADRIDRLTRRRFTDRLTVIQWGIPLSHVRGRNQPPDGTGPLSLVHAGRLDDNKSTITAIKALSLTEQPHHLTVIGQGTLREHLEQQAIELGL